MTDIQIQTQFPLESWNGQHTPFYCYDLRLLSQTLAEALRCASKHPEFKLHYAIKANFNPRILSTIAASGMGADCVSGGEIAAALRSGFRPMDIFFAGVGKRDDEIEFALRSGIGRFNVESFEELSVIEEIASRLDVTAPVSFRVNPDVGAHTLAGITTGLAENKFGIEWERIPEAIRKARGMKHINYLGLHFHIGSQILDMSDFESLCERYEVIAQTLENEGLPLGDVNVGGGLGIDYAHPVEHPVADFESYFGTYAKHLKLRAGQTVHFELGRSIVGPCGTLISRVLYVKQGHSREFAIIDGSMTELIRPALYHAKQQIENLSSAEAPQIYDVVGPVCESSDVFGKDVELNRCHRGDFIAVRSSGAYGESMASCYNCHPLPPAVFINE
jgi:diaminopimelate decarboxylase